MELAPLTLGSDITKPRCIEVQMLRTRLSLAISLLAATCLLGATPALASNITYGMGGGGGFTQLLRQGEPGSLGSLHGDLTLDHDSVANTFTFVTSSVWLDNKDYVFSFTGGTLHGGGAGQLDFDLVGAGEHSEGGTSGSFLLVGGAPVCCGSELVLVGQLGFWGGGGGGGAGITPSTYQTNPMPEPSAALAFAAGALFVHTALRRQTERQQRSKSS